MRRWGLIAAAFAVGLAAAVAGFRIAGAAVDCKIGEAPEGCPSHVVGEELALTGLVLLAVALLSAVVTVARGR